MSDEAGKRKAETELNGGEAKKKSSAFDEFTGVFDGSVAPCCCHGACERAAGWSRTCWICCPRSFRRSQWPISRRCAITRATVRGGGRRREGER
eukprot:746208-Hanusia_phi.AAC.2